VLINGKSYRLLELGSGLAQFILVLATVATKRPRFLLLDEPELNLHPALQLDFLTTIGSYASDGTVFATHTIGLAKASADRAYIVRPENPLQSRMSELSATPRLSEFLGELSYFGYREVGYDRVLLVEGPSDVTTFQQLLRAWGSSQSPVILQLGGGSLINAKSEEQLLELTRISDNISAVIDSERGEAGASIQSDRQAFAEICAKHGIQCHVLERRAVENYFTTSAVQNVMGEKYSALQPYQALKGATPAWAKRDNWRIAREMTKGELEQTDLGGFLLSL
jgi:energy-coupling factor transporter ATP-binding protein EcfA2